MQLRRARAGALSVAKRACTSGPSLFSAVLGPGAGGDEAIGMRQVSAGVAWAGR
jgi:hypothetical protein